MAQKYSQPHLTVLEGGRERKHPGLFTELLATTRGKLLALGIGGVAAASTVGFAALANQGSSAESILSCSTDTQELGFAPTKSDALVAQLPGIDGKSWTEIEAVPVTTPSGEIVPFGSFGPQGPPTGSEIPTDCTPN